MHPQYLEGGFGNPAADAAHAFRSVMEALARPGTIHTIEGARPPAPLSPAAGAVLLTLCDGTTPLYLAGGADCEAVRSWVAFHTGAPLVGPGECMFALGDWAALTPLSAYSHGSADYPDRSATLIVETPVLANEGPVLTGPGIRDTVRLSLPETDAFQSNGAHFPLGLDFLFTCDARIAGLPRSTRVHAPTATKEVA